MKEPRDPEGRCVKCPYYSRVVGCLDDPIACEVADKLRRKRGETQRLPRSFDNVLVFNTFAFNSPTDAVAEVRKLVLEGADGGFGEYDPPVAKMVWEKWPEATEWECTCVWIDGTGRVLVEDLRVVLGG